MAPAPLPVARLNRSKSRELRPCAAKPATQHRVLIKKGGLTQQLARARTIHPPPPAYLPEVPVHCGSAECSGLPWSRALVLHHCRGRLSSLLKPSTGMTGLPPPVVLPLASRPFMPVFMSLSVLHGRPRCQASFAQLPSSQDTMLSSVCRQRHFHGKGSELNPLLILSEAPCQADTVC